MFVIIDYILASFLNILLGCLFTGLVVSLVTKYENCDRGIIGFMLMIILVVFTIAGTTITQGLLA